MRTNFRSAAVGATLLIAVIACGGSMSETEYVESLNALVVETGAEFETSIAIYGQIADPTMADFVALIDRGIAIKYKVRERFADFDPPAAIIEVHQIMVDHLDKLLDADEQLVARAETVDGLNELEQTAEFAAYEATNSSADSSCVGVQAKINNLATRESIDADWIPDLRLTVGASLGCDETGSG